jgi:hypothetical protein
LLGFSDYRHRLVDLVKSIEQAAGARHPKNTVSLSAAVASK